MKKILMVLLLTSISIGFAWGQIRDLVGNQNVVTGETWMYSLNFSSALAQETNFIIRTGKYGTFNNSKDTARVEQIKKGTLRHDFFVTWGNTATNDAKIVAYKQGDLPANIKTLKVKVLTGPVTPPPSIYTKKADFDCPDYFLFNDIIECVAVTREFLPKFSIDKNVFDVISEVSESKRIHISNSSSYWINTTTLRLKAKQNVYMSSNIKVTGKSYDYLTNIEYHHEGQKTVKIHPKHTISTTATILCANQNGSYKLEPYISNVNWQPISNMTLASGQGTATATFKASGNGYGKVKATVTYDGKSYTVENSSVWVGKPSKPTIIGFEAGNPSFAPNQRFSLTAASSGGQSYTWGLTGDARYNTTPVAGANNVTIVTSVPYNNGQGLFTITTRSTNICGTSDITSQSGVVRGVSDGTTPPMVEM